MKEYRHFFITTCFTASFLLGVVASFNLHYDYSKVFVPRGFYYEFVDMLNKDNYIFGRGNIDKRFLKEALIKTNKVPEIVCLGSSRIMTLHGETFSKEFLNLWMDGARVRDYLGLLGIYQYYHHQFPQHVILSVEPWFFNPTARNTLWAPLKVYAQDFLRQPSLFKDSVSWWDQFNLFIRWIPFRKLSLLINIDNTYANYKDFIKGLPYQGMKEFLISTTIPSGLGGANGNLYFPDGSAKTISRGGEPSVEDVEKMAQGEIVKNTMYQVEDFNDVDRVALEEFKALINKLQNNGTKVYFYFPPYHPLIYNHIYNTDKYEKVIVMEMNLFDFAYQKKIPIIGNYDPAIVKWGKEAFFDETHPREEYLNKLFSEKIHLFN